jgi:hypothetical protein
MSLGRIERKLCAFASAAAIAAAIVGTSEQAYAQTTEEGDPVSVTGKGIVGGGLLGGEIVIITMGIIGVEDGWPYLVFGGLGAVGGAIGGYFIEGAADPTAEIPLYMLAGGMALVIPTIVVALNATAYKPPGDDRDPVTEKPAIEPAAPDGTVTVTKPAASTVTPARQKSRAKAPDPIPRVPLAMISLTRDDLALGLPAPLVRPLYTRRELTEYGVTQGHEVRVPVFSAAF